MAAYRRVYGFGHLWADCRGPRSAPEAYARFEYGTTYLPGDTNDSYGWNGTQTQFTGWKSGTITTEPLLQTAEPTNSTVSELWRIKCGICYMDKVVYVSIRYLLIIVVVQRHRCRWVIDSQQGWHAVSVATGNHTHLIYARRQRGAT